VRAELYAVSCASATSCLAVGSASRKGADSSLAMKYS
jgi:hypothetical protein